MPCKQAPNTTDVTGNLADASPLINVQVDPTRALLHGLTAAQVGQELRAVYSGTTVTRVTLGGTQEDVNIQLGMPSHDRAGDARPAHSRPHRQRQAR